MFNTAEHDRLLAWCKGCKFSNGAPFVAANTRVYKMMCHFIGESVVVEAKKRPDFTHNSPFLVQTSPNFRNSMPFFEATP